MEYTNYFKNAYMYGRGNSGKTILRRSKESHPTFGGFSTKLYDLDGNKVRYRAREELGANIAILYDTKGPDLRTCEFENSV